MENKVRLIDANALESKCFKMHGYGEAKFLALGNVRTAPTIDPESLRPAGRWLLDGRCSECLTNPLTTHRNYCPNCGAKMEG